MALTGADYYKYASLATAAYVRMGGKSLDGRSFADQAALPAQSGGRLPTEQARYFFDPANAYGAPVWNVLSYYGGDIPTIVDPIAAADKSGFAATLFARTVGGQTEKVLAIRGTEPGADQVFGILGIDLWSADLGQIGILGLALTQVVSMANFVSRLRTRRTELAPQIRVSATLSEPTTGPFFVAKGSSVTSEGSVEIPIYLVFESVTAAQGLEQIGAGETVRLTGHSLVSTKAGQSQWTCSHRSCPTFAARVSHR